MGDGCTDRSWKKARYDSVRHFSWRSNRGTGPAAAWSEVEGRVGDGLSAALAMEEEEEEEETDVTSLLFITASDLTPL